MAWTEERIELLKKLWLEGELSASQIAAQLGGTTRNAVIGKVHRMGLGGRAAAVLAKKSPPRKKTTAKTAKRVTKLRQSKDVKKKNTSPKSNDVRKEPENNGKKLVNPLLNPIEELVIPPSERTTIMNVKEYQCRWPIGDPNDESFHLCGRERLDEKPYCEFHARKSYQTVQRGSCRVLTDAPGQKQAIAS
jgi:GcrA cell cycle regulator